MKKNFLTLALVVCFLGATLAQNAGGSGARVQMGGNPQNISNSLADRINSIVSLTPDQYNKILEINKASFEPQNSSSATAADNAAGLNISSGYMDKVMAVLTPAQKRKLQEASSINTPAQQLQISNSLPKKSLR